LIQIKEFRPSIHHFEAIDLTIRGYRKMEHRRQVSRMLHDEHVAVIGLLERFSAFLTDTGSVAPGREDSTAQRMLSEVAGAVETEITTHFAFEEEGLFPVLDDAGYGDLGDSLKEDHTVILPMGRQLAQSARAAISEGFTEESWSEFHRLGSEFAQRLTDHARNEETGLLPVMELAIDEETDMRLAGDYAMKR
jgi:hemerythrin superfamily protein